MSKRIKITDFNQDEKNFNVHTPDGMALLEKSIEKVGVIESFTVSADDKIISGNARQEKIGKVLGEDVEPIIVETDGRRPVVLKRTDIQSGTKEFYEAAILANTTAKKNINLNTDLIQEVAVEEYGVGVEEVGVEIVDVSAYNPVITPSFGIQNVTDEQLQKKQEALEHKFENNNEKIIDIVCPECANEFKIKISKLLFK